MNIKHKKPGYWRDIIGSSIEEFYDDSLIKAALTHESYHDFLVKDTLTHENESYQTDIEMEEVAHGIEQRMDKFPDELIGYVGIKHDMEIALGRIGRNSLPEHCREVFERAINENFVR